MTDKKETPGNRPIKLKDLNRQNVFTAPEGYFDILPSQVQARIKARENRGYRPVVVGALKYALPAIVLVALLYRLDLWSPEIEAMDDPIALIDQVSSEDLIAYLGETDLTTEEILEEIDFDQVDLEFSNPETLWFGEDDPIDDILKEYDIEGEFL